jgi:hypothetical protein
LSPTAGVLLAGGIVAMIALVIMLAWINDKKLSRSKHSRRVVGDSHEVAIRPGWRSSSGCGGDRPESARVGLLEGTRDGWGARVFLFEHEPDVATIGARTVVRYFARSLLSVLRLATDARTAKQRGVLPAVVYEGPTATFKIRRRQVIARKAKARTILGGARSFKIGTWAPPREWSRGKTGCSCTPSTSCPSGWGDTSMRRSTSAGHSQAWERSDLDRRVNSRSVPRSEHEVATRSLPASEWQGGLLKDDASVVEQEGMGPGRHEFAQRAIIGVLLGLVVAMAAVMLMSQHPRPSTGSTAAPRFVSNDIGPDAKAQADLRNATVAAKTMYTDGSTYKRADASATGLVTVEPALCYVDGATASFPVNAVCESGSGSASVSVYASRNVWAAAAMSTSGVCWWIRDEAAVGTTYGQGATCTGNAAAEGATSPSFPTTMP